MTRYLPDLTKPFSLQWAMIMGLAVGIAFLPFRITPGYISGAVLMDIEPELNNGVDRATNVASAFYFAQDAWRFPLFQVDKFGPNGTDIVFTDSIPVAALLLKLANIVRPVLFNYFGLWVALCFVLNPAFFCWLLYELNIRDWRWLAAGAVLASCVPALLFRHGHASLCSHFLLLWALVLYFRSLRVGFSHALTALWFGLVLFSLLVIPYLFAMVLVIFMATIAQVIFENRLSLIHCAAVAGGMMALILVAMLACGHLTLGGGLPPSAWGFGFSSMNLLSPFSPWLSAFSPTGRLAHTLWPALSDLFPDGGKVDATGFQYEGYNYLGAGVLVLLAVHIFASLGQILDVLRQYWALSAAFGILIVVSLSNRVFLGHDLLFEYHFGPMTISWRISAHRDAFSGR